MNHWLIYCASLAAMGLALAFACRHVRRLRSSLQTLATSEARAREAAHAAKTTFLSGMSHEMRTPMTAILGFAELLTDEYPDDAAVLDTVEVIRRNGQQLLKRIDELLELARSEAEKNLDYASHATLPLTADSTLHWRISPLPRATSDVVSKDEPHSAAAGACPAG